MNGKKELLTQLLYSRKTSSFDAKVAGFGATLHDSEIQFFDTTAGGDLITNIPSERKLNEDFQVMAATFDMRVIPTIFGFTPAANCTPAQPYNAQGGTKNYGLDALGSEYVRNLCDILLRTGILQIIIDTSEYGKIPLRQLASPINQINEFGAVRGNDIPFVLPEPITILRDKPIKIKALFDKTTCDLVSQQLAMAWADEDPFSMTLGQQVPTGPGSSFLTLFTPAAQIAMELSFFGPSERDATALTQSR